MWRAVVKGAASLERNENCTYDPLYDIPVSNCSNVALFNLNDEGVRGECIEGSCVCRDGYTGSSDWINLDGLDCQVVEWHIKAWACYGLVSGSYAYLNSFRVLWKAFKSSKKRERTIKGQLFKKQNQVAISGTIFTFPVFIFSFVKLISPSTIQLDPARNPAFFTFTFLSLNAEWFWMSSLVRCIVDPILNGLNKESDRKTLQVVKKIEKIAYGIPRADLIIRIALFIIPALVAAASEKIGFAITVIFFQRVYSCAKVIIFGSMYRWCIHLVNRTLHYESMSTSSNKLTTGTTDTKLSAFKMKLIVFEGLGVLGIFCFVLIMGYTFCFQGLSGYGGFSGMFIVVRGTFNMAHAVVQEILFLDIFPLIIRRWQRRKARGGDSNLTTGSYSRKTARSLKSSTKSIDDNDEEFQGENPLRESQVHKSKFPTSIRTPNPVVILSITVPKSAKK